MTLTIPDSVGARLNECEVRRELALALYAREKLTAGQAADLAGMDCISFQRLLAERDIPMHYDVAEFEQDLLTLRERGPLPR